MEKDSLKPELFERFIANKSNAAELEQLFDYFGNADQQELENRIRSEFEQGVDVFDETETKRLDSIHRELSSKIFAKPESKMLKMVQSGNFIKAAAAILVVISISLLIAKFSFSGKEIVPGSKKGMLSFSGVDTLLNAQKEGVVYRHAGVTVTTKADGTIVFMAVGADSATASKLNTITTPNGGEYNVILSDGSKVMLNAGSKLTFPVGFRGAERKVSVEGEAFFNVAKDPSKPFIVNVGGNEIKVLGTQFNVSNYPEDAGTETTLLEGSIKFSNAKGKQVILQPNQQVASRYGKLDVQNVSAEDFNAWTKGSFLFNDVPLNVVMQKLARWYNVDIDAETIPQKNLYIKISRQADFEEVLEVISKATDYTFELKGNKIVLKE